MNELTPLEQGNLSTRAYRQLRQALLEGRFAPGQKLRIGALAEMLGTSTTPVREAIFRLASERALELKAATAISVPENNADRLAEVLTIRIHLEGEAAAAAAERITPRQIGELAAAQDAFVLEAARDPEQASVVNRQIHFRLLEISDMPILAAIVENLWVTTGPFMRLFHTRTPRRELTSRDHPHFALLAALERRDAEAARVAMQTDIRWARAAIEWARDPAAVSVASPNRSESEEVRPEGVGPPPRRATRG